MPAALLRLGDRIVVNGEQHRVTAIMHDAAGVLDSRHDLDGPVVYVESDRCEEGDWALIAAAGDQVTVTGRGPATGPTVPAADETCRRHGSSDGVFWVCDTEDTVADLGEQPGPKHVWFCSPCRHEWTTPVRTTADSAGEKR